MNSFVTGGSGFVGGNLIRLLLETGHNVRALARSNAARDAILRMGAEPLAGDLADLEAFCAGMSGCAHPPEWGRMVGALYFKKGESSR
jgi:dihydroflavonol-4-reductase